MTVTDLSYEEATKLLEEAGGPVKTALVMALAEVSMEEARARLKATGGFVRLAARDDSGVK